MESHKIKLQPECKKITENQKIGRNLEQAVTNALTYLKIAFNHNPYSDKEYPLWVGGQADQWNDFFILECKNPNGTYKWTRTWVQDNAIRETGHIIKRKVLVISTIDALTKPAIDLLLREDWFIIEVGFQVTEDNSANATWILYHSPIVTLLAVEPYKEPLIPIPDDFDLEYLLLQPKVFDDLYLQSKIDDLEQPDYELLEDRAHI
jgi:hypothetical protein